MAPERFWTSRLRWRLRGATQWPAFVVLTLLDGLVLDRLPPVSTTGLNFVEGVLVATFANLVLIGALAPFLARRLARRPVAAPAGRALPPPEVKQEVLRDRTATVLLGAGLLACLVAGLANIRLIVSETEATERAGESVRDFVKHANSAELSRNVEAADTRRLAEGLFRVCIPRDERGRFFCLFIDTEKRPTKVTRDPSAEPNSEVTGP